MILATTVRMRLYCSAVVLACFCLAFVPLCQWLGPNIGALGVIPVVVVAALFGRRFGVLMALAMVPISTLLLNLANVRGWDAMFRHGGGPGLIALLSAGLAVGWLRELLVRLQASERAARMTEQRFGTLNQRSSDGITIADRTGKTLYHSPAVANLVGFSPDALVGTNIFARVHPDDQRQAQQLFVELLREPGGTRAGDLRIRYADDTWRVLEVHGTNLLDEPGIGGIVLNCHDVTKRTQGEQLFISQAAILERIAQDAPLADTLVLLAREIEAVGDGALVSIRLLERDQLILRCVAAPSLPGAFTAATETIPIGEGVGACGTAASREAAVITVDITSDPLWAEYRDFTLGQGLRACWSIPILAYPASPGGARRLLGTFAVYYATPRKPGETEWRVLNRSVGLAALAIERARATEALQERETQFRYLFAHNPHPMWVYDSETLAFLEVNDAAVSCYGYTPDEFRQMRLDDLRRPEEAVRLRQYLADGSAVQGASGPWYHQLKDGREVAVEIASRSLDYAGHAARLVVAQDVSARLQAQDALRGSEERFRALVQHASDIITILDQDGTRRYISPAIERVLGYTPDELDGRSIMDLVHPDDLLKRAANLERALHEPGVHIAVEFRIRHRDGSWRDWEAITTNLLDEPSVAGLVVNARDVTERVQAERDIRRRNEELAALNTIGRTLTRLAAPAEIFTVLDEIIGQVLGNRSLYIALHDEDRREISFPIYRINGAPHEPSARPFGNGLVDYVIRKRTPLLIQHDIDGVCASLGIEAVGQPCRSFLAVPMLVGDQAIGVIALQDYEHEAIYNADHRDLLATIAAQAAIALENGRLYTVLAQELAERRRAEGRLAYQATHDPLTGLPNRVLFLDRLGQALARSRRDDAACAVLFLDLDNFKVVNDTLGHDAGDRLLVAVADRLRRCLRDGDTLGRQGGDEFTVLLERVVDVEHASEVARRLACALEPPIALEGQVYRITASIGMVVSTPEHARPDDLLRDADIAMYRAKAAGGADYMIFDPAMQEQLVARLALERDLRDALDRGEFSVQYQPIVDLATGQIAEAEALVRWRHPLRGNVPPDTFIPVVEETGLIVPLGRWVLQQSCQRAQSWNDLGYPLTVAVNLSAREFQQADLTMVVAEALRDAGLAPQHLRLEITERLAMRDAPATAATLATLRALGVQVAIDDFGTGYSSLAYLKRFPVDALKIDRSFVAGMGENAEDTAIVGATIGLARTLGLAVVAEGVETMTQAAQLRTLGCTSAQGYYFARPLASEAFGALLAVGVVPALPLPIDPRSIPTTGELRLRTGAHPLRTLPLGLGVGRGGRALQ